MVGGGMNYSRKQTKSKQDNSMLQDCIELKIYEKLDQN